MHGCKKIVKTMFNIAAQFFDKNYEIDIIYIDRNNRVFMLL